MLLPLVCLAAKEAGTVNGGFYPFILTVDCSGFFCYQIYKLE